MPRILKFQLSCPECHEVITGQMEEWVVAQNRVPEHLSYWQEKHKRVCPSNAPATPVLEGTRFYGEYGQDEAEHPERTIFIPGSEYAPRKNFIAN